MSAKARVITLGADILIPVADKRLLLFLVHVARRAPFTVSGLVRRVMLLGKRPGSGHERYILQQDSGQNDC